MLDRTNGPLTVTLLIVTAEVALFDRVKVFQAVPVPTAVLPKLKLEGVKVTVACMANGASRDTASQITMR